MKKLIVLIFSVILVLSLFAFVGCGSNNSSENSSDNSYLEESVPDSTPDSVPDSSESQPDNGKNEQTNGLKYSIKLRALVLVSNGLKYSNKRNIKLKQL